MMLRLAYVEYDSVWIYAAVRCGTRDTRVVKCLVGLGCKGEKEPEDKEDCSKSMQGEPA
jgi:hypothetical protein